MLSDVLQRTQMIMKGSCRGNNYREMTRESFDKRGFYLEEGLVAMEVTSSLALDIVLAHWSNSSCNCVSDKVGDSI